MTKLYDTQVAVYSRLQTNEVLKNVGVYDYIDDNRVFPYVVLGRVFSTPERTKTTDGERIEITLDIWSGYNGKKETIDIMKLIEQALDDELMIDGADVITQEVKNREAFEVADSLYKGTIVYEILLDTEE